MKKNLKIFILLNFLSFCLSCKELESIAFNEQELFNEIFKTQDEIETKKPELEIKETILELSNLHSKFSFLKALEKNHDILVLKSNFLLNLEGENLKLKIPHLISKEGAKIITFPPNKRTNDFSNGRADRCDYHDNSFMTVVF